MINSFRHIVLVTVVITFLIVAFSLMVPELNDNAVSAEGISTPAPVSSLIGDLNDDSVVDSTDYTWMKRFVLHIVVDLPVEDDLWAADINGDGEIDSTDITLMKRFILKIITSFPKESMITPTPIQSTIPTSTPGTTPTISIIPTPTSISGTPYKLKLTPDMVINEVAQGDAGLLVDEQDKVGDPPVNQCTTGWFVGYKSWYLPSNATIDLGRDHVITSIYVYDAEGIGSVKLSYGQPFCWMELFTIKTDKYKTWQKFDFQNIITRHIQISRADTSAINEIVVYGYPAGPDPTPTPVPTSVSHNITVDKAVGINAFIDDPLDKIEVAGFVREYHSWSWDEADLGGTYSGYPNNQNKWNPSYAANGYWFFDKYYTGLFNSDIVISPCIQRSVMWLTGYDRNKLGNKPVSEGEDPKKPGSYAEHADHMYQYAARYGSTVVDDSKLKLAPDQPRNSGMGLINYYENWNEPDMWWGSREDYFDPYELAAMTSADYDGHAKTMGDTLGVKNADPKAKLVMGGLAGIKLNYLKAMKFWFDFNRPDGKFAADVINLHHYSNNGTKGISPEEDNFKEKLETVVEYRNKYLPEKEVWITEFGWDTNPDTYQSAPSVEVQGQWIVRGYMACLAAGVDRIAMYMLRDVDPNSTTQYSSCGLVGPKGDWTPKPSWYYVYTMRNRLSGMVYMGEQDSGNPDVWVYKFKELNGSKGAYVIWCPTSNGTTVDGYTLSLSGSPLEATLVTMEHGDTDGVPQSLSIVNGSVTVDVSERPVFVMVDDME